jgi:hypothetical protein
MMLRIWIVLLALLAPVPIVSAQNNEWTYNSQTSQLSGAATGTGRDAAQTILNLELAEVRAWNNHDLQGVLAVYWASPNLISIAGDSEVHGFDTLQKALFAQYANPDTMGQIDLDTLSIQLISDDTASCVAGYVVKTQKHVYHCDDTATLRRLPEGWRIVFERATMVLR